MYRLQTASPSFPSVLPSSAFTLHDGKEGNDGGREPSAGLQLSQKPLLSSDPPGEQRQAADEPDQAGHGVAGDLASLAQGGSLWFV